jgi:1,4-alpha-glucan branching enzyme
MNATPVVRAGYRLGVPKPGFYTEILNTDAEAYGGSNVRNAGGVHSEPVPWQGRDHSVLVELPPLSFIGFVA